MTYANGYDMTCDAFGDQLADYLEGDTPEAVRVGMEAHAAACPPCAELLAGLQGLSLEAAALPALAPSRDLWTGIAERIDARVLPLDASRIAPAARRGWARPAMAAAALVLVTAGVTNWLTRASMDAPSVAAARDTAPGREAERFSAAPLVAEDSSSTLPEAGGPLDGLRAADGAESTAATGEMERSASARFRGGEPSTVVRVAQGSTRPRSAGAVVGVVPARLASNGADLAPVDPVYDRDITVLRQIVRERSAQLDPATVAVLEASVAVIDSAIAQSRAALAKDPASRFLATQLNHSLEKKIELLRTAAMLPART